MQDLRSNLLLILFLSWKAQADDYRCPRGFESQTLLLIISLETGLCPFRTWCLSPLWLPLPFWSFFQGPEAMVCGKGWLSSSEMLYPICPYFQGSRAQEWVARTEKLKILRSEMKHSWELHTRASKGVGTNVILVWIRSSHIVGHIYFFFAFSPSFFPLSLFLLPPTTFSFPSVFYLSFLLFQSSLTI